MIDAFTGCKLPRMVVPNRDCDLVNFITALGGTNTDMFYVNVHLHNITVTGNATSLVFFNPS